MQKVPTGRAAGRVAFTDSEITQVNGVRIRDERVSSRRVDAVLVERGGGGGGGGGGRADERRRERGGNPGSGGGER